VRPAQVVGAEPRAPARLAFNVSAREFQLGDACERILQTAAQAGVSTNRLEVDITETAILADPVRAAETARDLREAGVTASLDDFGTGYSSLTHLRELPIDRVKLDRSFVGRCLADPSSAAIIESVTMLAHRLGLEVVAEGVENEEELAFIRRAGCDIVQGYHFARPLPADECQGLLRSGAWGACGAGRGQRASGRQGGSGRRASRRGRRAPSRGLRGGGRRWSRGVVRFGLGLGGRHMAHGEGPHAAAVAAVAAPWIVAHEGATAAAVGAGALDLGALDVAARLLPRDIRLME
jgi:hypothetical protein